MTREEFQIISARLRDFKATTAEGLMELLIQMSLMTFGIWLSFGMTTSWVAGQILLGICFWRSFAILHACGHHAFTSRKSIDDTIGVLMSLFCFIPYYAWKFIHHDHHKWTGWIDRDPTMRNLLEKKNERTLNLLNIAWRSWIPVISIHYIATIFFRTSLHEKRKRLSVAGSIATVILFHAGLIILLKMTYLKLFGLSAFIYLNIGDLSLLTQHVHIPMDHTNDQNVLPKKNYEQADFSHTMTMPAFVSRWIIMNFNHHAFHHILPTVPYYKTGKMPYSGKHTHHWREWIWKAKTSRVSELIYHDG